MRILGLTGSIGMGKSTAARMLRRLGVPVHDADATVHALMARGGAAVAAVERAFPGVVRQGAVDRAALGQRVFGDPAALRRLEGILHPLVRAAERRFLRRHARRGTPLAVLDIPLLFETGADCRCDRVAVVWCRDFLQAARVLRRPGMTPSRLAAIRAQQMPVANKRRRADFDIPTGLGRAAALRALAAAVTLMRAEGGRNAWPPRFAHHCRRKLCARSSSIPKPPASIPMPGTGSSRSAASS